jgi:hypothetical protein
MDPATMMRERCARAIPERLEWRDCHIGSGGLQSNPAREVDEPVGIAPNGD